MPSTVPQPEQSDPATGPPAAANRLLRWRRLGRLHLLPANGASNGCGAVRGLWLFYVVAALAGVLAGNNSGPFSSIAADAAQPAIDETNRAVQIVQHNGLALLALTAANACTLGAYGVLSQAFNG